MSRTMMALAAALLLITSLLTHAHAQEPSAPIEEVLTWKEGSPRPKATLDVAR